MILNTFDQAFEQVKTLVEKFRKDEKHYLETKYQEAEVRQDFLDKFFVALGWDVYHHEQVNPYEREVKIEKSVMVQGRGKRADYAFYTAPNFAQARFMAEAKKPSRQLENAQDCFQAIRYGWNSNTPISVLTDFEQFLVLDSRYKPSIETSVNRIVKKFHYTDFADEEKFRELYYLFSREAVGDNSLETFAASLKKSKGARQAKLFNTAIIQPIDEEFLNELDEQRVNLARAFKNRNPELDGETLTEITQRTLDRLVFLRFLEDKLVEPDAVIDGLGKKSGSAWQDFIGEMPRLDKVYNGTLFRAHSILDNPNFAPDERAFGATRDWLAHINSPYDFNSIPIHILGSIYERFLGKTIETTDKRATVVDKPEVRKAGGVYYTPEYIVRYIVENTIGKLLFRVPPSGGAASGAKPPKGGTQNFKTPEEIAEMRFADIACGSGSFLLGVFDYLIKYHVEYFNANKTRRDKAIKEGLCRETAEGTLQLSIHFKREILTNNIYGVDLDAQAVEVAQLSLYLKLLEEETTATKQQFLRGFREQLLPSLGNNIVHGNSLIDYDIMDGMLFDTRELKQLNPMNFAQTFPEIFKNGGFDAIVGNPPYVFGGNYGIEDIEKNYFKRKYVSGKGKVNLFTLLIENGTHLLKENGLISYIIPNTFLRVTSYVPTREFVLKNTAVKRIVDLGAGVFKGATTSAIILILEKKQAAFDNQVGVLIGFEDEEHFIEQKVFLTESYIFALRSNPLELQLSEKIKKRSENLGNLCAELIFGVVITKNKDEVVSNIQKAGYKPFLEGKDISRYIIHKTEKFLNYTPELLHRPRTPKIFEAKEKLMIQRITGGNRPINVAYDNQQFYNKESINNLILKDNINYDIKYILGLLNSKLINWIYAKEFTNESTLTVNLSKEYLSQLPIRAIDFNNAQEKAAHYRIVELVEKMLGAKKSLAEAQTDKDKTFFERYCASLDGQIDALVYDLYELTPDEIKIIENGL